jgi:hypothetical protein
VAVSSSDVVAYSTDGINWTTATMPSSVEWKSIAYGDGKFVAVAHGNARGAYSEDGINWMDTSVTALSTLDGVDKTEAICSLIGLETKADIEHVHSWDDLENKPFYESEKFTSLLEKQTLEIDGSGTIDLSGITLVEGDTYKIVFNETNYECTAWYDE